MAEFGLDLGGGAKYKISPDEEKQASGGGAAAASGGFESDKEKIDSMLAATQKPANVLDPFSPRMQKWDKLMFSFLIFTAVITPFETRREVIFACGDVAEVMYFLHKGIVSCGSSCTVYKSGDHIGLDALLPDNRRETAARSLTFVVSYMLSQEHLYSVLENGDFPQTASKIRRHRAKLALKRKMKEIVALAKAAGLICPDGVRFSENERIFKDRGQVDEFKGTLKPSPSPEEFELKRAKVLDEIDRDKAEGEKLRKKLELEYLLGRQVRSHRRAAASRLWVAVILVPPPPRRRSRSPSASTRATRTSPS